MEPVTISLLKAVSYTHLDVYKRQPEAFLIADAFMDTAPPDVAEIINGFKKKPEDHQGYSTHI